MADAVAPFIQLVDETFRYNTILTGARTVGSLLMLAGLVAVWAIFRQSDRRAIMGITLAYQVAFLFNAVTLPWYFASSLTLVGTFKPRPWLIKLTVAATVVVALSFMGSGNHRFYDGWWMLLTAIAAWLAARRPLPERAE